MQPAKRIERAFNDDFCNLEILPRWCKLDGSIKAVPKSQLVSVAGIKLEMQRPTGVFICI